MWVKMKLSVEWWVKKKKKKTSVNKTLKSHRKIFSCVYTIKRHKRQRQSIGLQSHWAYFQSYTDLYSRLHVIVPRCLPVHTPTLGTKLQANLQAYDYTSPVVDHWQNVDPVSMETLNHFITPPFALYSSSKCFSPLSPLSLKTTGEANQARIGYYIVVCMCFIYGCERMYIKWFFLNV